MKIVLCGDLGSTGGYHVGDEAMAESVVEQIGARSEVEVVAVSGDPQDTVSRYGWGAVPRIGFASLRTDAQRDARLDAVLQAAGGETGALPWADDAWKVIHAVTDADAVVISGGGNLSSTWPEHIYERAALARLAALFNKRLVVTGQTIGPHLTGRHGELVAGVLTSAVLVGVREAASRGLALRLGVVPDRLVSVVDDAAYLRGSDAGTLVVEGPYIAATFSPDSGLLDVDGYVSAIADLLTHVSESSGLKIVLVPHHAKESDSAVAGDLKMHDSIAEAVGSDHIEVLPILTAREVATITRNAALVISTRYHPVVFALGASVPALGIGVDCYTSIKIRGSMENYGVENYAVSVASLALGGARAAVDELLASTDVVTAHLDRVNEVRKKESAAWWDAVVAVLEGGDSVSVASLTPVDTLECGEWSAVSRALRTWSEEVSLRVGAERIHHATLSSEAAPLVDQVAALEREVAALSAELSASVDEIESLRAGVDAAHQLVSAKLRPVATWIDDRPSVGELRAELDAVYSSRAFRLATLLRRIYVKARTVFRRRPAA